MRKQIIFLVGILLTCASLQAQVSGRVFEDKNSNGKQDQGEKGMAGVVVTNGKETVRTGLDGCYQLPVHTDSRFLSVTCPAGFRNSGNYYLLLQEARIGYNFGISKESIDGKKGFSFIQITDTELFSCFRGDWIDGLKDYIRANPVAFMIHTGDICYERGMQFHARHLLESAWGIPYYSCIGNHDLVKGKYGEEFYETLFGPVWYSFDAGNYHFVVLPMLGGDHAPSYSQGQVMEWLRNDLALCGEKPIVVFAHDLWFQEKTFVLKNKGGETLNLLENRLKGWIYGHWHNHFYHRTGSGVQTYCSSTPDKGGIDHGPACFRVFSIDEKGQLSSHTQYAGIEQLLEVAVPGEGEVMFGEGKRVPLVVNTYRTASRAVTVKAGVEKEGKVKRWLALKPSTDWSWQGELALLPGDYVLKAEAEYADGSRLCKQICFKVQGDTCRVELAEDWANLGGNAAHCRVVDGEVEFPLRLKWVKNTGGYIWMASPVVADEKVFVATIDDDLNEKCHLAAYDALSGRLLWKYRTRNSLKNTIVYDDGLVMACDAEGYLYAVNAVSGGLAWELKLNTALLPPCQLGLVVENGVVYAGQGHGLTAVSVKEGRKLWENRSWQGGEGTTSSFTFGDGVLVASSHWNALFGHEAESGKLLWKLQEDGLRFRDGSPTFWQGDFYLASVKNLFRINPRSGEILQQVTTLRTFNSACAPLVTDQFVIVTTSDGGVSAFDRKTFQEVWNYQTAPAIFYTVPYTHDRERSVETSPVLIGNTVLFGASDGSLHAVDLQTGLFQWKKKLGAPVLSTMAVCGNMLYVADFAGNVYGFILKNKN